MKPIYEIDKQANNENEQNTAVGCDDSAGQKMKTEIDGEVKGDEEMKKDS